MELSVLSVIAAFLFALMFVMIVMILRKLNRMREKIEYLEGALFQLEVKVCDTQQSIFVLKKVVEAVRHYTILPPLTVGDTITLILEHLKLRPVRNPEMVTLEKIPSTEKNSESEG